MNRTRLSAVAIAAGLTLVMLTPASAAPPDIVLTTSDVTITQGNWATASGSDAAGGQFLSSVDSGWSTTTAPFASPNDFFEATFTASANTPYHVWLRLRASENSKYNDSVWVQFNDATDLNGAEIHRIGSAGGLLVNLENCSGCGMSGWGWQDKAFWLSQASTIQFPTSGTHRIRVQTREDGVQLDQIVLSASTYLANAPGQAVNDATLVTKPPTTATTAAAATPFYGTPIAIPGMIHAPDFDSGGEGFAYHDATPGNAGGAYRSTDVDLAASTDGGNCVGWIDAGEWLNYTVNVAAAGNYIVQLRVASPAGGGLLHLGFNGRNPVWTALSVPATGDWQIWTTVSVPVALGAGQQVMTLVFDTGGFNLTSINLAGTSTVPSAGAPPTTPSTDIADGITGITVTPNLRWQAAGATSFDVRLGTSNPPPAYISNVSTSYFGASALAAGTTYYWQVLAKNTAGSTTGPVWTFTTDGGSMPAALPPMPSPAAATPAVPSTTIADGTVGMTVTPNLLWDAAGASAYDLRLGTSNPPAAYASNISSTYLAPSALSGGTKYYWQVLAKNAAGTTAGPVWTFTTVGAWTPPPPPPPPPAANTPALPSTTIPNGMVGMTATPNLRWDAAGATSYDLRLSTANPPSAYISNITASYFAPSTLGVATKYYWQVVAKNAAGSTVGPVWSFTTEGGAVAPPPPAPTASSSLRIMTWNIQSGLNLAHAYALPSQVQFIAAQNPDVVVLQEVSIYNEDQPTIIRTQLQQATGRTWYASWGPACATGGCIGNLILSRIPMVQTQMIFMPPSAATRAVIYVGGVPIQIFANHLDAYNTSTRSAELYTLMNWARSFGGPRLVAGDFNAWWGEWWILQMETEYSDTWRDYTGSRENGYTVGNVRFDFIFRSFDGAGHLTPANAYVPYTELSDHRPVVADFRVQ